MKNLVIRLVLLLAGAVFALLIMEGLLHMCPAYSFDAMAWAPPNNSGQDWQVCRYSEILGYELNPKTVPGLNSFGMRCREYPLVKPAGTCRILLLGDSITETGNWSRYVEDELNRNGKYEILNAAVRGWGLFQYHAYAKFKSKRLNPDILLIGFCLNDMHAADLVQLMAKDPGDNNTLIYTIKADDPQSSAVVSLKANQFLFLHSYLYRFLFKNYLSREYLKALNRKQGDSALAKVSEMKKLFNGKMLGIVFPYLKPLNEYTPQEKEEYEYTIKTLDEAHVDYLDLTQYFNTYGRDIVKFRRSENDKVHFNEEAKKIKAGIISKWLKGEIGKIYQ